MNNSPQNVNTLRNSNRATVLGYIRRAPVSRIDISRNSGLTKSAVTMLTNELISDGIVYEVGLSESNSMRGRTSILLDISSSFAYAVGISLHRNITQVAITDLKMNKLCTKSRLTSSFLSADEAVSWCADTAKRLLRDLNISESKCVGVGISSPGPLDRNNGVILSPPHFPLFCDYPVVERIKAHFNIPVFLENNSVTLALADYYMRGGELKNSLFVVVSDGIGSALIQNGSVFYGAFGFAGELGHICVDPRGKLCKCGNKGCLEQYATLKSVKEQFGIESYERTVDKALKKDLEAEHVIEHIATYLSQALINCVNLFDLEEIVLFGEYAYHQEILINKISKRINEHSLICRVHPVEVMPSLLGFEQMDVAASVSALNYFFDQQNRQKTNK